MPRLTHKVLYSIITGVLDAFAHLPPTMAYWLGARLGDLAYLLLAGRRRITLANLALALGEEQTLQARHRIARGVFRNLGQHLVDFSRLHALTPESFARICTVEGLEQVQHLLERRKGLLILSAHFGSWELSSAIALHLGVPLHIIVRPLDHTVLNHLVETRRQRFGSHIIPKRDALGQSLAVLRRGEVVGVLMDQSSLRHEAVQVEFFGIKTHTSKGPALLAMRAHCPVVGLFMIREAPGQHRLVLTGEIPVRRTGNVQRDIEETSRLFNQVIETYIRCYPDHWLWLHRRWKQRHP
ncbi:MAG TPA: lysophospholipid acyltransferase family protein [Candidatus Tectomicrobia bacterium]|jgi:KDO2-lipid IV(A) lauroyltransferase